MADATELLKLFVIVPAGTEFDGTSTADKKELYFEEGTNTLWAKGKSYGISAELAAKITTNETAIAKLVALIGAAEKGADEQTILARIEALETATSKPIELAEGEKVLTLDATAADKTVLSTTLGLNIVKHAESEEEGAAEHEYIQLLGKENVVVAEIAADQFVKDGMIDSVAWKKDAEGHDTSVLLITWNTDAGKTAVEVDMAKFIDTYTSGDETALKVEGYVITPVIAEGIYENEQGLVRAAQVYEVREQINDSLSMIGTILVGNGDTYMDEETAERYFKTDEEGKMVPSEISSLQDITDLRHANEEVEKATSIYGTLFGGYNDPALTEEIAETWLEKDDEGDWVANGRSVLPDIFSGMEAKTAIGAKGEGETPSTGLIKDIEDAQGAADAAQATADGIADAIAEWNPWKTFTAE